ncbi:MAG: AraC family transcriptional regulator [Eubacteriales bacterium]|nr:AraC family transcriptional regulator [Eubacteriales bacterium]
MDWVKLIADAIAYMENHLEDDITVQEIAKKENISPFYFQKGFSILCGYSVSEYLRCRRLSEAGRELLTTDKKVIDIALKYGYESPDSFSRAFYKFHGCTPTDARNNGALLKSYAPLKIKLILEGGTTMEYRIEKKEAFTVMGISEEFSYEHANSEIPAFWDRVHGNPDTRRVMGMYGICYDSEMAGNSFRYMIADDLVKEKAREAGLEITAVPAHTWAVFPCRGAMPLPLQELNRRIFSEWLPANEYEIAEGYNIEYYSDPAQFPLGTQDPNYYTEVWIPVKKK